MDTWSAEELPYYLFQDPDTRRGPDSDFHAAMSEPTLHATGVSESVARLALLNYLNRCAVMQHVIRAGESHLYYGAADAISAGLPMVRVHGRVYRLREPARCERQHGIYQHCPACTVDNYPNFQKERP